ncbi:MAG: membrane dipeptidase [Planctomycetaceae bacterium]|nr:membrane dipeptidase [Planctomycetaceae bacterium]
MRLIDLHTDWLLQYAPEATVFDAALYPRVRARLGQSEGYLQGTWAAVLSCYRAEDDWARQADPWAALGQLLARVEAEFCGRLLFTAEDVGRWLDDPEGLCWGIVGVEGFDALVRSPGDLDRLAGLFTRGVRLFQPVYAASSVLGGSSTPGDERGLTDLGRAFLEALADLAAGPGGPCPVLDLAHLNPHAAAEALDWFEADDRRATRLIPVYSHGAPRHEGFATPRAITPENLRRLRALGGVVGFSVGPPFYDSAEALKAGIEAAAAVPFRGRPGFEGIAIGTDFLGVDQTLPGLGGVTGIVAWLSSSFDPVTAVALIQGNARQLLARIFGHGSTCAGPS